MKKPLSFWAYHIFINACVISCIVFTWKNKGLTDEYAIEYKIADSNFWEMSKTADELILISKELIHQNDSLKEVIKSLKP